MNLSQLYYFAKLSEMQHYANAAKELYITQPSLSHAIKSLEAELGAPLFEREGRRMKLTPLGRAFAEHVKRGLREIDKGVALAQEYNGKLSGTVNIGAIYTVQGDYLPMLLRDYHAQYGQTVKFNLFQGFSTPLVEALERDEYDVAFTAKVPNKPDLCFEISLGGMVQADPRAVGLATLSIGLKSFSDIVIIPIEDIPQDFHRIYMVYKRDAFRSRAVESFIEFTSDYVPPKGAIPSTGTFS